MTSYKRLSYIFRDSMLRNTFCTVLGGDNSSMLAVDNKAKYIKYLNKFKTIRIKAEQLYYANEFTKNSHNLKKPGVLLDH